MGIVNGTKNLVKKAHERCKKSAWECTKAGSRFAYRTTKKVAKFVHKAGNATLDCAISPIDCGKKLVGEDGLLRQIGGMVGDWAVETKDWAVNAWKDRRKRRAFCNASPANKKQCEVEDA